MANVIFNSLTVPVGVAFDAEGNLYLSTLQALASLPGIPASEPSLVKLSRDGAVLNQLPLTGTTFANPKLDFVPELNSLVLLTSEGVLAFIDPATLEVLGAVNITQLGLDTTAIYDVATGQTSSFGGLIQPQFASYGDVDTRVIDSNTVQFFVTGLSQAQSFPFVARLELELGVGFTDADVILASNADALSLDLQTPRLTRGIAVNDQGTVLTTLPLPTQLQPVDSLVAFSADFDPTDGLSAAEGPLIFGGIDIYSQGLTTDAAGNFYITTNSVGTAALGFPGEGALVGLTADLSQLFFAQGLGLPASSFRDVAVDPVTGTPFVTVSTFSVGSPADDLLVSFPLNISAQATTLGPTVLAQVDQAELSQAASPAAVEVALQATSSDRSAIASEDTAFPVADVITPDTSFEISAQAIA